MEKVQNEIQKEVALFQSTQREFDTAVKNRSQLESQLKENEQVSLEFEKLREDSVVYKMVGPCLLKQDQEESKQNVAKRIEFIKGEIKRSELVIKDLQAKQEKSKAKVQKFN